MATIQRAVETSSLAEVINIILDKGIVIDAWATVSLLGIQLLAVEARVVIASVDTYLRYAAAIGEIGTPRAMKSAALPTPAPTVGLGTPVPAATAGV